MTPRCLGCVGVPWVNPVSSPPSSSPFLSLSSSDAELCWQLRYRLSPRELLPRPVYDGPSYVSHVLAGRRPKPKRFPFPPPSVRGGGETAWEPSRVVLASTSFRRRTDNVQLSGHLLRAEAVGDLARVAAAVLLPQVADGQARQTPCPAGVRGQRAAVFQPAHSGVGVTSRNAGELDALSRIDFPRLETVQDGRGGLVGVWGGGRKKGCFWNQGPEED